jgi:hypothetical protein
MAHLIFVLLNFWFPLLPFYYRIFKQLYDYVMTLPGIRPVDWKEPSPLLLRPATSAVLFVAPVADRWVSYPPATAENPQPQPTDPVLANQESRLMFVSNSGLWCTYI